MKYLLFCAVWTGVYCIELLTLTSHQFAKFLLLPHPPRFFAPVMWVMKYSLSSYQVKHLEAHISSRFLSDYPFL